MEEGDDLQQRYLDLERQVGGPLAQTYLRKTWFTLQFTCLPCPQLVLLSEEKQSLALENAALRERMGRSEVESAPGLTAKKLLLLQSQLEQLQEENFRCGQSGGGGGDRAGPGLWGQRASSLFMYLSPDTRGWRAAGKMIGYAAWNWSVRSLSCNKGTKL